MQLLTTDCMNSFELNLQSITPLLCLSDICGFGISVTYMRFLSPSLYFLYLCVFKNLIGSRVICLLKKLADRLCEQCVCTCIMSDTIDLPHVTCKRRKNFKNIDDGYLQRVECVMIQEFWGPIERSLL